MMLRDFAREVMGFSVRWQCCFQVAGERPIEKFERERMVAREERILVFFFRFFLSDPREKEN